MWWLLLSMAAWGQPLLEAYVGPERSVSRVNGMGGAHVAIAESMGVRPDNPAAFAVRRPLRSDKWFNLTGELGAIGLTLFEGHPLGPPELDGDEPSALLHASGLIRLGPLGFGLNGTRIGYAFDLPGDGDDFAHLQHGWVGAGAGWQIGEVVVGVLPQLHYASVTVGEQPFFGRTFEALSLGVGMTAGVRWAPERSRWKFGARAGPPVRLVPVGDYARTVRMVAPLDLAVGVAWSTLRNAAPTYGVGEAPQRGGKYLLLAADLVATGPTQASPVAAIAMPREAGAPTTFSLHLGAEAEVIERRLAVRLGGYNEPGRFADVDPRLHGTAGLSVLVADLPYVGGVRLTGSADVARDWTQIGVGIGAW